MHRILNIAIFVNDATLPSILEQYGTYGDIWQRQIETAVNNLPDEYPKPELRIRQFDIVNCLEYPDPDEVDCILLTGSKFNAFDNDPWIVSLVNYIRTVWEQHSTKLIGICFGHQIIARAAGAKVGRGDKGWELSRCAFNLTEEGSKVFRLESQMYLQQSHRDIVLSVPDGFVNLGGNDVCEIQGMYSPGRVLTVQGHPEFTPEIMCLILDVRHKMGIFDEEVAKDARRRAYLECNVREFDMAACRLMLEG